MVVQVHPARRVMPEEIFGGPSWSHCMPSLMICCPYIGVFTGERERFPSWIDDPVPSDSEKEDGNDSSKGLFLERMSQVAITLRMMLPARGAAFDIREEKGHGS